MTDSTAENRELIEATRKVGHVLSLFAFALQEQDRTPTESLFSIAAMLTALADDIRERAATQATNSATARRTARSSGAGQRLIGSAAELPT